MAQGNTSTRTTRNRVTRQVFRFLESFLEQFVDMDTGVMVPAPFLRFLPVLNCLLRTPLHTGKTELALVVPDRFFVRRVMFSVGHTRTQVPHPVQVSSV